MCLRIPDRKKGFPQGPGTPVPPDHFPKLAPGSIPECFQFRSRFPFRTLVLSKSMFPCGNVMIQAPAAGAVNRKIPIKCWG